MTFLCSTMSVRNFNSSTAPPGEAAARSGNKLVCQADHYLGTYPDSYCFLFSLLSIQPASPKCHTYQSSVGTETTGFLLLTIG
jgi:hypothetical protein